MENRKKQPTTQYQQGPGIWLSGVNRPVKPARTILAVILSFCLTAGLMPGITLADADNGKSMVVTEFEPLEENTSWQVVPAGTKESELKLPAELKAFGYEESKAEDGRVSTATTAAADEKDEPMPEIPRAITITGVTWEAEPGYDGAAGEEYVFTAKLKPRYELEAGVEPPQITVAVKEDEGQNLPTIQAPVATNSDALPEEFSITRQPHDVYALAGQTVTFQVEADGEEVFYQWQKGVPEPETAKDIGFKRGTAGAEDFLWSDITGAEEAAYTFEVEEEDLDRTVYRCVLFSGLESLTTKIVKVQKMMVRSRMVEPELELHSTIYANGVALILVKGTGGSDNNPYTVVYLDEDRDGEIDIGVDQIWNPGVDGFDHSLTGNDLSVYTIYGGSNNAEINGGTKITAIGGKVMRIWGGGYSMGENDNASVSGDCTVTIGEKFAVYEGINGGGCAVAGKADVGGNCLVEVKGTVSLSIIGGGVAGMVGSAATATCSSSLVEISGNAQVGGSVYGGGSSGWNGIAEVTGTIRALRWRYPGTPR